MHSASGAVRGKGQARSTWNNIRVSEDHDACRISAVLEALGYKVLRELDEGDAPGHLRWAVSRLARRHRLTEREQDVLERVLYGSSNQDIGRDLEISRATVKWHMHNVFAKTNTYNRESLLRLALQSELACTSRDLSATRRLDVETEHPELRETSDLGGQLLVGCEVLDRCARTSR